MTPDRRNKKYETPFGAWLREHPELDSQRDGYDIEDIDETVTRFMNHKYRDGYLELLEVKEYSIDPRTGKLKQQPFAQKDTQSIINQALQFAFNHPDFYVHRIRSDRPTKIRYGGYPLVQFERTTPDNGRIWVDGKLTTKEDFLRFLKFEGRQHLSTRNQLLASLDEIARILQEQERWEDEEEYHG